MRILHVAVLVLISQWALASEPPKLTTINITMTLKVADKEAVFDELVQMNAQQGGYFSVRSDQRLSLRTPRTAIPQLKAQAERLGTLASYSQASEFRGFEASKLAQKIKAKEQIVARYFDIMEKSETTQGILAVEQEIIDLTAQIEQERFRLQQIQDSTALAQVDIYLQFRDRSAPRQQTDSPFPWLNEVNLIDLLEDFR